MRTESDGTQKTVLSIFFFSILMVLTAILLYMIFDEAGTGSNAAVSYPSEKKTVIIDAGHGGRDGGATSVTGTLEKELNLKVAKALESLFAAAGYEAVMTRTGDEMLTVEGSVQSRKMQDLQGRYNIVKKYPDAFFVSIHMNKFPQPKYYGLSVYYSINNEKSKSWAEAIRLSNAAYLQSENTRAVKAAGSNIFLLYKITNPAILVECGFLSNQSEAELLDTPSYQMKLACMIFSQTAEQMNKE